jgi:hypothetical protein
VLGIGRLAGNGALYLLGLLGGDELMIRGNGVLRRIEFLRAVFAAEVDFATLVVDRMVGLRRTLGVEHALDGVEFHCLVGNCRQCHHRQQRYTQGETDLLHATVILRKMSSPTRLGHRRGTPSARGRGGEAQAGWSHAEASSAASPPLGPIIGGWHAKIQRSSAEPIGLACVDSFLRPLVCVGFNRAPS